MNDIYVCGHRNPDTDSIVASMAYANLRNALGDREYKAVRIGSINGKPNEILGTNVPSITSTCSQSASLRLIISKSCAK